MPRVRVTQGIADEYERRDVYRMVTGPGWFELAPDVLADMIDDADHYASPDGPDMVDPWLPGMYRAHAVRLRAAK